MQTYHVIVPTGRGSFPTLCFAYRKSRDSEPIPVPPKSVHEIIETLLPALKPHFLTSSLHEGFALIFPADVNIFVNTLYALGASMYVYAPDFMDFDLTELVHSAGVEHLFTDDYEQTEEKA